MMFYGFDSYYFILVVPTLIFAFYAQFKVTSTFNKFRIQTNSRNLTGADAAREILLQNGIFDVTVERISGNLNDHFDPKKNVIRLSDSVYSSTSVTAVGVAAHETGHAIQHTNKYIPLILRSSLVPVANIGSAAGPYLAIIGLLFSWPFLLKIGILLFGIAVLFYLVTLPVEFNASSRAINILSSNGILSDEEIKPVKKVLQAAAMTYVASAAVAMANLLRFILIARNTNRDD